MPQPHQSTFNFKRLAFESNFLPVICLLCSLCSNIDIVSARLEKRFSSMISFPNEEAALLDEPYPNEPAIFTVVISGTNPAIAALTNAATVTIGGTYVGATASQTESLYTSVGSISVTSNSAQSTAGSTIVIGSESTLATSSQFTGTVLGSKSVIQISSTPTLTATITSSASSPSFVVSPSSSPSSSTNLQTFTGALGNISAPQVFDTGNGEFEVEGDSSFNNEKNALSRSCAVQHNDCGNAANADHDGSFTVNDCDTQEAQCNAVAKQ